VPLIIASSSSEGGDSGIDNAGRLMMRCESPSEEGAHAAGVESDMGRSSLSKRTPKFDEPDAE
jgi:hypothetical protein